MISLPLSASGDFQSRKNSVTKVSAVSGTAGLFDGGAKCVILPGIHRASIERVAGLRGGVRPADTLREQPFSSADRKRLHRSPSIIGRVLYPVH
jgi:hypothetical protein